MVNVIVDCGAVPALVKHLQAPAVVKGCSSPRPYEHEVEKGSAYALGLLAVKVIRVYCFLAFVLLWCKLIGKVFSNCHILETILPRFLWL